MKQKFKCQVSFNVSGEFEFEDPRQLFELEWPLAQANNEYLGKVEVYGVTFSDFMMASSHPLPSVGNTPHRDQVEAVSVSEVPSSLCGNPLEARQKLFSKPQTPDA